MTTQTEIINLSDLIPSDHIYRQFAKIIDIDKIANKHLSTIVGNSNYKGYGINTLFKALLLQHLEDLSDRELERFLQENNAGKWFCDFNLSTKTPTYSIFSKIRTKIGTRLLAKIFNEVKDNLKTKGYINEVFTFIDASHLVARANLWQERDQAIGKKLEKLNNQTLPKVAYDKQAKFGAKSKNKFWYGFKKHISVDMQSGLINKVALTPANITDANGLKHVCPASGEVYADKGYCDKQTHLDAKRKGCTLRAILKNNMKDKNTDRDKFISKMRSPYERVFSKTNHRTRYKGVAKNQFAVLMESLAFNFKRRVILEKEYGF
ncbi:Mobile element protein [uncultured Candidatus Thioglobus sp.]|nr:Mobile element protein [uncultured Candidatus Thioglobus sp.]